VNAFHVIDYPNDGLILQVDVDSVHCWCLGNFMLLNISKTRIAFFSYNEVDMLFYTLYNSQVILTDCMKNFVIYIDCKLSSLMMFILFFKAMILFGLIYTITFAPL
jgi:hypothetical protein